MRMNLLTSNVLHQILEPEINVVYNSENGVFDKILFSLDINFFNFNNNKSYHENYRNLPETHIDLYSYDLYIDNSIINYKKNSDITRSLHVNSLIFEHNNKHNQLKKEDVSILNSQLNRVKKIFFDEDYAKSWNLSNSLLINYGVPLDIFKSLNAVEKKDILVYYGSNKILGEQVRNYLKADIIEDIDKKSLNDLNKIFNEYRLFVDMTNNLCLSLCSICSGCNVSILSDRNKNIPGIYFYNNIEDIIKSANIVLNQNTPYESVTDYISNYCNYELFKTNIYTIIKDIAKREAYII